MSTARAWVVLFGPLSAYVLHRNKVVRFEGKPLIHKGRKWKP